MFCHMSIQIHDNLILPYKQCQYKTDKRFWRIQENRNTVSLGMFNISL